MKNKLQKFDKERVETAYIILKDTYDYTYIPHTPLTRKLETILNKIEKLLQEESEEGQCANTATPK